MKKRLVVLLPSTVISCKYLNNNNKTFVESRSAVASEAIDLIPKTKR